MLHFWVKLHAIKVTVRVRHCRNGAGLSTGDTTKPIGQCLDLVTMAHPYIQRVKRVTLIVDE